MKQNFISLLKILINIILVSCFIIGAIFSLQYGYKYLASICFIFGIFAVFTLPWFISSYINEHADN